MLGFQAVRAGSAQADSLTGTETLEKGNLGMKRPSHRAFEFHQIKNIFKDNWTKPQVILNISEVSQCSVNGSGLSSLVPYVDCSDPASEARE